MISRYHNVHDIVVLDDNN